MEKYHNICTYGMGCTYFQNFLPFLHIISHVQNNNNKDNNNSKINNNNNNNSNNNRIRKLASTTMTPSLSLEFVNLGMLSGTRTIGPWEDSIPIIWVWYRCVISLKFIVVQSRPLLLSSDKVANIQIFSDYVIKMIYLILFGNIVYDTSII